jgi:hypothetical protein
MLAAIDKVLGAEIARHALNVQVIIAIYVYGDGMMSDLWVPFLVMVVGTTQI